MIALEHARFGEPAEVIAPVDVNKPAPNEGEIVLRVLRSPIHNHDLATIRGTYGYKPKLPAIGGTEFLGLDEASGIRYVASARGAWTEYVRLPAGALVQVPDGIEDDQASQLLAMPLSAVVLFDELRTQPGMWIAQNAAAGAVGRIVMSLAQKAGVNIVNFVRRDDAAQELKSYGAQYVVVTERAGWQEEARALTGGAGFARIVDSVAGPQTLELQQLLAHSGELVIFGGLSGQAIKLNPSLMISQESVVRGFWMTAWMQRATAEQRAVTMERVFRLALSGSLPLPVSATYPLSDAAAALRAAETPGRKGKVLFRP